MDAESAINTECSKQKIKDGYQIEVPDEWLKNGNPFELKRPEYAKEVRFGWKYPYRI